MVSKQKLRYAYHFAAYLFIFICFSAIHWSERKFGSLTVDQILFHLDFGGEMLLKVDHALVRSGVKNVLMVPLVLALLALLLDVKLSRWLNTPDESHPWRDWLRHPWLRVARWFAARRALIMLLAGNVFLLHAISAFSYLHAQYAGNDYLAEHYKAPRNVRVEAVQPRNLVLIYVESLEATYGDQHAFGKDLLARLHGLSGASFPHYRQMPGTGWTMAGIVGTQCGIPLKNIIGGGTLEDNDNWRVNRTGAKLKSFLPGAVCLGDILHAKGYTNVFMGGASLNFAGKGTFFHDHHYDQMFGREEWEDQGMVPDPGNDWGFLDHQLLGQARLKLKELHASGKPFNLTLLTLDTHGPSGFYSEFCKQQGARNFAGIVSCTSSQLADFVTYMRDNGMLQNTNVVIIGDHLVMRNPVSTKLERASERSIFNMLIGENLPKLNRDTIVHFDMLPTILEFIGFRVPGDRMGLGYSAINEAEVTLATDYVARMETELPNRSELYWTFWKKPE